MKQRELDEAVAAIRGEQAEEHSMKDAAKRVFGRLFDSAFIAADPAGKIRGCADVRALIPAYISRTLSAARELLVEDHTLNCVDCRRALREARSGETGRAVSINKAREPFPFLAWGLAATLVIGIALGVTGALHGLLPWQSTIRATVASVQGKLYRVTDLGMSLVEVGAVIRNTDELRTAKGSRAILRLAGGGQLELAERSEISINTAWRGATVNLERGQMIVDGNSAHKAFYVTNGDMTIPVKDTVLALDRGTKDSRVAVAKGSIEVEQGQTRRTLRAGQQWGADFRLVSMPVASEFAWSQNADSYLALLNELTNLQKDLQAIPTPGLRYGTTLAQYLPADTILYAAIPNLGNTISEAKKLFDSRLAESEVLRDWWQQQAVAKNGEFDRMVTQISSLSGYLGDEIVLGVSGSLAGNNAAPVLLAKISQPGLADYLRANLPAGAEVQIVTGVAPSGQGRLLVDLDNNILVASPNAAALQAVEQTIPTAAGAFTGTKFFARIGQVYQNGAGSFLAADLEQIGVKSVSHSKGTLPPGFENVQYLVLERKDGTGDGELRAALSFDGTRHGIASWLGAPAPAGSLDFVSPTASFAATIVMKNPRAMVQELIGFATSSNANFSQTLKDFEAHAGVSLLDDVATPLGSDVTFAVDGPLLPIPAWKVALEVNDPTRLQQTLAVFVERFNQQAAQNAGKLRLDSEQVNGRTFYSISNLKAPELAVYYTFIDGYLLAASSEGNLAVAIQNKQAGQRLTDSPGFRDKLPADGYANFSAMVYSNLGSTLAPLAGQIKSSVQLTPGQQQSLAAILTKSGPGLICVYGEPERIVASAKGSFLGFDLGTLMGIHQGKPLNKVIASTTLPRAVKGVQN